jgi:hypothetical protein
MEALYGVVKDFFLRPASKWVDNKDAELILILLGTLN